MTVLPIAFCREEGVEMTEIYALQDGTPMSATAGLAVRLNGANSDVTWVGVWQDPNRLLLRRFDTFAEAEQECFYTFGLSMRQMGQPQRVIAQIFGTCMATNMGAFRGREKEFYYMYELLQLDRVEPEPEPKARGRRRHGDTTNIITGGFNNGVVARDVYGNVNMTDGQPPVIDGPWEQC